MRSVITVIGEGGDEGGGKGNRDEGMGKKEKEKGNKNNGPEHITSASYNGPDQDSSACPGLLQTC